jgi:hypothetical protein
MIDTYPIRQHLPIPDDRCFSGGGRSDESLFSELDNDDDYRLREDPDQVGMKRPTNQSFSINEQQVRDAVVPSGSRGTEGLGRNGNVRLQPNHSRD